MVMGNSDMQQEQIWFESSQAYFAMIMQVITFQAFPL